MRAQFTNSMPSLNVACVFAINSRSSMPMRRLKNRMWGSVASPTPTMPISLDSTRRICRFDDGKTAAKAAAVIQPAVPPPTMTIRKGAATSDNPTGALKKRGAQYRIRRAPFGQRRRLLDAVTDAERHAHVVREPGPRQRQTIVVDLLTQHRLLLQQVLDIEEDVE